MKPAPTLIDLEETYGKITLWEWVRAWLELSSDEEARVRLLEYLRQRMEEADV
jgi:hypothetical protein